MLKFLGKFIFPDLPPWQRDMQMKIMLWIAATLLLALIVGGIILFARHGK
jgi:cytochrome b subunit of formate dehydrogenase